MRLTNKLGLPQALVDCVENDPYDNGGAWRSVTQLCAPPRLVRLKLEHDHEIEQDVAERLYMMYGQIVHGILERANVVDLAEQRLFLRIKGKLISGAFDTLRLNREDGIRRLSDWKFSTAWKAMELSEEWLWQMNFLKYLFWEGSFDKKTMVPARWHVKELEIVLLMRDHSKPMAKRNPNYPQLPVARLQVPVWGYDHARQFLEERVQLHLDAEKQLPECSKEERWARDDVFAVMKEGRKSAIKLYEIESEAVARAHSETVSTGKPHTVVKRPGENIRCEGYCLASKFCEQFKEIGKHE